LLTHVKTMLLGSFRLGNRRTQKEFQAGPVLPRGQRIFARAVEGISRPEPSQARGAL
jgi:hypothetical protein